MRRLRGGFLLTALPAAVLCFVGAAWGGVSALPDADNLAAIQERAQEELNRKAGKYSEEARQKARQSRSLLEQLNALRREAAEAQVQVKRLEEEVSRLEEQGAALKQEIANAGGVVSSLGARLRTRVVDLYKYSPREGMNIFLSTRDAHDALTAAYLLGRLVHQDHLLLQEFLKKSTELTRSRAALEESRAQAQHQAAELKKRRAGLDAAIRKTDALLKDIRGQQRKAEAAARELAQAQQELGNRILALRKQRGTPPSEPQQVALPSPPPPQPEPVKKPSPPPPAAEKKRPQTYTWLPRGAALEWPLRGTITTPFGSRVHPVFRTKVFNSGIDIKAASGTPVRAAGPGEVLFRGWLRGFGQVVIIDHGGELSTVYGHLATTAVEEGDAVRTGSVLGTAGNSGTDTASGLHFEVRRGGAAQNPLNYLRKT